MTRKRSTARLSAVLAVATSVVLTGCGGGSSDEGGEAGGATTLNVTLANHPWTDAITERLPEFEEESGISVETSSGTADQISQTYNVKLNSGAPDLDVMMYRPLQEGVQFARNEWLYDLTENVSADPAYEWEDFQPATVESVSYEGAVYGIPIITERELLFYNTALLEEAGVEVPTTFEELEAAAAELHDPDNGVYGFAARGQRAAAVTQFSGFLYSHGGDFIVDGEAAVNTPEAVEAYDLYGRLLREYGPVGVESMSTEQIVPLFSQGQIAMYTDAEVFWNNFVDPETSTVVDSVGVAPLPAGPAGSRPYNVPSWGLSVNAASEKTDAAWEFVSWATSPQMVADLQREGSFGARQSVWDDPESLADLPADFAEALRVSTETGVGYDRPQVVQVARARDIVGGPIIASIQGGDVQEAADQAQRDLEAFLVEDATATAPE